MTRGEIVCSVFDYAQEFVRNYNNPKMEQKEINAIVVDFINYFAYSHYGINLAMYTRDLRYGKKMSEEGIVLHKNIIFTALNFRKDEYNKSGIIDSVNRNRHMNECDGKVKVDNAEAVKLIEDFIKSYMTN